MFGVHLGDPDMTTHLRAHKTAIIPIPKYYLGIAPLKWNENYVCSTIAAQEDIFPTEAMRRRMKPILHHHL
jgi:hypothetical protein